MLILNKNASVNATINFLNYFYVLKSKKPTLNFCLFSTQSRLHIGLKFNIIIEWWISALFTPGKVLKLISRIDITVFV